MFVMDTKLLRQLQQESPLVVAARKPHEPENQQYLQQWILSNHNSHSLPLHSRQEMHSAFWILVEWGHYEMAQQFLLTGNIDPDTYRGKDSVLHRVTHACCHGHENATQFALALLEKGANPNPGHDKYGQTPLVIAAYHQQLGLVQALLEYGARVNDVYQPSLSCPGRTALFEVVACCSSAISHTTDDDDNPNNNNNNNNVVVQMVATLLQYGADPNLVCGRDQETCLHKACRWGLPQVVQLLLQKTKAINNIQATNLQGETPLHAAMHNDSPLVAQQLLQAGAKVTVTNLQGETALHLACRYMRPDLVEVLCHNTPAKVSAFLHQVDNKGNTALDVAVQLKSRRISYQICSMLLQYGADPNQSHALHHVCSKGIINHHHHQETLGMMQLLLQHGANPLAISSIIMPQTPLEHACHSQNLNIIFMLLKVVVGMGGLRFHHNDNTGTTTNSSSNKNNNPNVNNPDNNNNIKKHKLAKEESKLESEPTIPTKVPCRIRPKLPWMLNSRKITCFQNLVLLLVLMTPWKAQSWGKDGHEVVGNLAFRLLSKGAQDTVIQILAKHHHHSMPILKNPSQQNFTNTPLGEVADWADQVRVTKAYHWSGPLHYIDIQDTQVDGGCPVFDETNTEEKECHFFYDRDCKDNFCVAGAIANYTNILSAWTVRKDKHQKATYKYLRGSASLLTPWAHFHQIHSITPQPSRLIQESLMFLTHFVGDIHQPLHSARSSDKGGNSIEVTFNQGQQAFSQGVRRSAYKSHHHLELHAVWDTSMIERALHSTYHGNRDDFEEELFRYIVHANKTGEIHDWLACPTSSSHHCTSQWGEESFQNALKWAYTNSDGKSEVVSGTHLSDDYYDTRLPQIKHFLSVAGVRLAVAVELALAPTRNTRDQFFAIH